MQRDARLEGMEGQSVQLVLPDLAIPVSAVHLALTVAPRLAILSAILSAILAAPLAAALAAQQ